MRKNKVTLCGIIFAQIAMISSLTFAQNPDTLLNPSRDGGDAEPCIRHAQANITYYCCDQNGQNCNGPLPRLTQCVNDSIKVRCYETEDQSVCEPDRTTLPFPFKRREPPSPVAFNACCTNCREGKCSTCTSPHVDPITGQKTCFLSDKKANCKSTEPFDDCTPAFKRSPVLETPN
jgi:hypothetical protein